MDAQAARKILEELKRKAKGEALFRPSSAARIINCPGSVRLAAQAPKMDRPSRFSDEGTAAHKIAEDALRGIRQPDEYVDRPVAIPAGVQSGTKAWFVDDAMAEAVQIYVDAMEERTLPGCERFIEQKLSLASIDPFEPLWAEWRGTADCVIIDRQRRKLTIGDLKFGRGIMVAGDSPQLKVYALMGLLAFYDDGWDEIETVVVQPRAPQEDNRVKPVSFKVEDLTGAFLSQLAEASFKALEPDAPLNPDPKGRFGWCHYCPARESDTCPALRALALDLSSDPFASPPPRMDVRASMGPVPTVIKGNDQTPRPVPMPGTVVLPLVTDLDPGEIATILDKLEIFESWASGVKQRAVALQEAGVKIPGWGLKQSVGHRKFTDVDSAVQVLQVAGVTAHQMYTEPKLRSPAQIEKLRPKTISVAEWEKLIKSLVFNPLGQYVLVKAEKASPALMGSIGMGPITQT